MSFPWSLHITEQIQYVTELSCHPVLEPQNLHVRTRTRVVTSPFCKKDETEGWRGGSEDTRGVPLDLEDIFDDIN